MLIRISLILAIIAGLGSGAWSFIKVKEQVELLQTDRNKQREGWKQTTAKLESTTKTLKLTADDLERTKGELVKTTRDLGQARELAQAQAGRAEKAEASLAVAKSELRAATGDLAAFKALGMDPPEILAMRNSFNRLTNEIAGLNEESRLLGTKITDLKNELDKIRTPERIVFLPPNLAGKVLVTDPKWGFVILNIGTDQGVLRDGELLVNRNGRLVAKVVVHSIQRNKCVANILPGWQLTDIYEGDLVIPAHPES
jgi:hypothetical protein